jgi:lipoprotein-releasing system permease protein
MAKVLFKVPAFLDGEEQIVRFLEREAIGKDVMLVVPELTRGPSGAEPNFFSVRVKGIYKTGFYDFDLRYVLTSLGTARILKQMPVDPPSVQFLELKLDKPNDAGQIGLALSLWAEREHDSIFVPMAWTELNPVLLEAVKVEKVVMAAILTLVVLVAAFGISSTLVMTVIEKTREIGTLMALGTRRLSIMAIFVINGWLVGFFGVVAGTLAGVGICAAIDFLRIRMPGGGEVYVLEYLPVEIRGMDVLAIVLFSLLASTLAGVYPAWKASRLHPVEALGHE